MQYKNAVITTAEESQQKGYSDRLLHHETVQYVLRESWFCGLRFYVDANVLIPRPETEELVEWIISHCKFPVDKLHILDMGTGSGCIAVALKRRLRKAEVWALDNSEGALEVAKKNAEQLGAEVRFILADMLDKKSWETLPLVDVIVSNPPYIPESRKAEIAPNVLDFEPHSALFAPDDDPYFFYRALAQFAAQHLLPAGQAYAEIHEGTGTDIAQIFAGQGFQTELKKDMQGKDRMLRAWR